MEDKDAIIAELREQITMLLQRIQQLEDEVARLKKDSNNSSKLPSSDIVKPKKTACKVSRKKRKRGGQIGHRKFSRPAFAPEHVDKSRQRPLPRTVHYPQGGPVFTFLLAADTTEHGLPNPLHSRSNPKKTDSSMK